MTSVCFYFQVHQPYRIRKYEFFDIGYSENLFDDIKNREALDAMAATCYLPANRLLLNLIRKYNGAFRISYSISGVALEQFENWRPDVLESFKELVNTGCVEILSETYYHSLSSLYSKVEFKRQIREHMKAVRRHFGVTPSVFRNTELIYNNEIATYISELGYSGILAEGVDRFLGFKTPNYLHHPPDNSNFTILLRNSELSDDIAFRFSNENWTAFPLRSETYAGWIHGLEESADVVNLFMDYRTFGVHQPADTGIFDFLRYLPKYVLGQSNFDFKTPSEIIQHYSIRGDYNVPGISSWTGAEKDLSAWQSNPIQLEALRRIYDLKEAVYGNGNSKLLDTWMKLTTSDHFYNMCTKYWIDGDIHKYFSPYETPLEAFNYFNNACAHLEYKLSKPIRARNISIAKKRELNKRSNYKNGSGIEP